METNKIVIDSNIFIWAFCENDSLHKEAINLLKYHENSIFIIPYPVVQEVCSIFSYRFWKKQADNFIKFLQTTENILLVNNDINHDINFFLKFKEKISFTDISLIWTAVKYSADLATFDKQLLKLYKKYIS